MNQIRPFQPVRSSRRQRFFPNPLAVGILILLTLGLAACSQPEPTLPAEDASQLETIVAGTLGAYSLEVTPSPAAALDPTETDLPATSTPENPTESPEPTVLPTLPLGHITGSTCFPGNDDPAMTVYYQKSGSDSAFEIPIKAGQASYEVDLPDGAYQAYAWLPDFSRGGAYSKAVACGLQDSCTDHSLLTIEVKQGAIIEGVDLCDWYGGPFAVPYPPGVDKSNLTGGITGALIYPGGSAPEVKVFFFNLSTQEWGYYRFKAGSVRYSLTGLPPGEYHVVAYDENGNAGGHAGSSHNLLTVSVKPGQNTSGVDITDWNAPEGAFPPDPTR